MPENPPNAPKAMACAPAVDLMAVRLLATYCPDTVLATDSDGSVTAM
jgi:hypothetical protein